MAVGLGVRTRLTFCENTIHGCKTRSLCTASSSNAALRVVVFRKRRVQNGWRFASAHALCGAERVRAFDSERVAPHVLAIGF